MEFDITQITGIVLGSILLLSVAWVWVRKQVLGFNGFGMSIIGMLLISVTLWQKMNIEVSPDGLKVEVEQLRERVNDAERELKVTKREVSAVETRNRMLSNTVVELTNVATQQNESYNRLQRELVRKNIIDNGLVQPQIMVRPELLRELQQLQGVDP